MKKVLKVFLLLCLPSLGFAQGGWGNPENQRLEESQIRGPKITWTQDSFVLGEIPQGEPVDVIYELTNTGNAPLIISNVEPACDCTAAEWPKGPIMPGQKATIVVQFDAAAGGKFSKIADVTSNAKPTKQTLLFTGTVVSK